MESVAEMLKKKEQWKEQGDWVPANGGAEEPFATRTGRRLLYVYQPRSGKHAYLDLGTDLILSDEEAWTVLGMGEPKGTIEGFTKR